jgi:SAM-dependent methyltransferase
MPKNKISSKDIGLEIGLLLGKHLFKTEYLHYGYWTENIEIDVQNLAKAQDYYADFLSSNIPENVKSILDVGCGAGKLALQLLNNGYDIECVSPSKFLTRKTKEVTNGKVTVYEDYFENINPGKKYDLILFSESYQYINLEKGLDKIIKLLNENGHLLICDFFKLNEEGKNIIGGGHKINEFFDKIAKHPLKKIKDIDITKETAPTIDILNNFSIEVFAPSWNFILKYFENNYPFITKLLKWKFKKKIEKINRKYCSGERNSKEFIKTKTYRLFLYRYQNAEKS